MRPEQSDTSGHKATNHRLEGQQNFFTCSRVLSLGGSRFQRL